MTVVSKVKKESSLMTISKSFTVAIEDHLVNTWKKYDKTLIWAKEHLKIYEQAEAG